MFLLVTFRAWYAFVTIKEFINIDLLIFTYIDLIIQTRLTATLFWQDVSPIAKTLMEAKERVGYYERNNPDLSFRIIERTTTITEKVIE